MQIHKKHKNHTIFLGLLKDFQWFGFMISTDNAIAINEYFLIEIRFLWLRFWYTYDFEK